MRNMAKLTIANGFFLIFLLAGCSSDDDGSCPGSIISSCVDSCPQNCSDQGKTEVCIGAGFEPNRCCYCE